MDRLSVDVTQMGAATEGWLAISKERRDSSENIDFPRRRSLLTSRKPPETSKGITRIRAIVEPFKIRKGKHSQ